MKFLSVGMLGLGMTLGLQAQEAKPFAVGLNLVYPLDGLKSITHKNTLAGVTADFTYSGMLANSGVPYRASFALGFLPGKEEEGVKTKLVNYQIAGDILTQLTDDAKLNLVTGISINHWARTIEVDGSGVDKVGDMDASVKGIKFGGRFGLDYQFDKKLSGSLLLQVIELGNSPYGIQGYNPSWIQVGAKYHF